MGVRVDAAGIGRVEAVYRRLIDGRSGRSYSPPISPAIFDSCRLQPGFRASNSNPFMHQFIEYGRSRSRLNSPDEVG